jgi:type I restriction enzyme S subunit
LTKPAIKASTFQQVCSLVTDGTHDSPKLLTEGVPFIKGKHIARGSIDFQNCDYISSKDHLKAISRSRPEEGDTIISNIGSVGATAFVNTRKEFSIKNVALLKPNPKIIHPRYLYYYVIGDVFQAELQQVLQGVAQPFISLERLRGFRIEYHEDLSVQRHIASILSAYDDLIENNTRRIKIHEAMAQAIYREWFVEFRAPGVELRKATPEEQKLTGKDVFPKGWEVKNLFDVAHVTYGFPFKGKDFTSGVSGMPVIRIRNLKHQISETYTTQTAEDKYRIRNGDILVGMDGDFNVVIWAGGEAYQNQRIVRFRPKGELPRFCLAMALEKPIQFFDSTVTGTTVAHLSDEDLRTISIVVPGHAEVALLKRTFEPLFELKMNLTVKNTNLRLTRDLLLPKLISGEVGV